MKLMVIVCSLVALPGCANAYPWTVRDTALQSVATALLIADGVTTSRIQYTDGAYEADPIGSRILGEQPSTGATVIYFAAAIVASYFIARALPKWGRTAWQGVLILEVADDVIGNCQVGLC